MTSITHTEPSVSIDSNGILAKQVLEELIFQGVEEFCVCPGARNAPFVYPLAHYPHIRVYYWSEERSAAFFALGRIKATGCPVAVITTSGTAVAELLPATMEAYYTGLPLILLTADRPRRFRGTGAPQSAEQVGIFHCYAHETQDLAEGEFCCIGWWRRQGPLHLNVCFEEPKDEECQHVRLKERIERKTPFGAVSEKFYPDQNYLSFLRQVHFPFVVVGALPRDCREETIQFLIHLNAPVYAEGISGIREDSRLEHLCIQRIESLWKMASDNGYPIDGVLRLGGVPTARFWRDLEIKEGEIPVYSVSEHPFSGLSCAGVFHTSLITFYSWAQTLSKFDIYPYQKWKEADRRAYQNLLNLFQEEPLAEASLMHSLSKHIPLGSKVYLGNSLPIREWDQAATYQFRDYQLACNRGVNGIDGQLSTFLGFCSSGQANWSILGDLTLLYDLVAPWVSTQLGDMSVNVVVVNNGGAGIFSRMFSHPAFQNTHQISFESFAQFWKWHYERWESVPDGILQFQGMRLIELVPCARATERFLKKLRLVH